MSFALMVVLSPVAALGEAQACGGLIRVTTLLDEDGPEGCTSGSCSLREAVAAANACRTGNTTVIALAPGRHELHRRGFEHPRMLPPATRARGDSAMIVTGRIRIEGDGSVIARALDAPPFRLFDVAPGAWLALSGVRLSGGLGGAEAGGGIHVQEGSLLFLDRSQVTGAARLGGGIYAAGVVSMREARVQGGQAERGGGLFVAPTGRARIERSEFVQNLADGMTGFGGAIEAQGEVAIRDTTFTGNTARHGAAVSVSRPGKAKIIGGVFAENSASESSGALELLDADEIADARFERNAPKDCVLRSVQDRATRGCTGANPSRALSGLATVSDPDASAD